MNITIALTKQPMIPGAGVASRDSQLYAIGGYDGTQHLNSTECYSACADRWMALKDMHCKRCYVGKLLYFTKALSSRFSTTISSRDFMNT